MVVSDGGGDGGGGTGGGPRWEFEDNSVLNKRQSWGSLSSS